MHVCRRCGELAGMFTDPRDDRVERQQKCACRLDSLRPSPTASIRVGWPSYDFNTAVELCFCCCAEVLHTGSFQSPLFCAECQPWVQARNDASLGFIVPTNRLQTMDTDLESATRTVEERLASEATRSALLGGMTRLKSRRRDVVAGVIEESFAQAFEVSVAEYLESQQEVSRFERFLSLSELFPSE